MCKTTDEKKKSTTSPNGGEKPSIILKEAPPPWHTSALIVLLFAYFAAMVPKSLGSMDEIANKETFLHVNFPYLLTTGQVACIRIVLGSVMILDSLYAFFYGKWEQDTEYYYPYSQLKVVRDIPFRGYAYSQSLTSGFMTLSSFTMWSWVLEGLTFILLGGLTWYLNLSSDSEPSVWFYRLALIGWEISAPTSILVSAIVKYVLWPMALEKEGENNANLLKHPGALLEHNWNVLSCLVEVALLGGMPIRYQDYALAPLFGLFYVLYSYAMVHSWAPASEGPQLIYPFLDTTMEWRTTGCLLALLGVLTMAFGIFCALDHFITEFLDEGDILSHVAAVVVIGATVCRFRD